MRRLRTERIKQNFKLRLLALVLALALLWYSVNPAPPPIVRRKQEDEPEDAKKRAARPELERAPLSLSLYGQDPLRKTSGSLSFTDEEEDDFDWPEYIDG